jgi:hypothetical protein
MSNRDSIVVEFPPHPDGPLLPYPGQVFAVLMVMFFVLLFLGNCVLSAILVQALSQPFNLLGGLLGLLGFVAWIVGFLLAIGWTNARPYPWLLARIDERPDAVVTTGEANAYCMEEIPPANWSKAVGDNGVNMGLLLIDEAKQMLLYESDRDRWVIPREQLISCEVRHFRPNGGVPILDDGYIIDVRFRMDDLEHSRSIAYRPNRFMILIGPTRRKNAEAIRSHVLQLLEDPPPLDPRCDELRHYRD